jgi:hypothetical protein
MTLTQWSNGLNLVPVSSKEAWQIILYKPFYSQPFFHYAVSLNITSIDPTQNTPAKNEKKTALPSAVFFRTHKSLYTNNSEINNQNAAMPVWARPRIRAWMSWVPS